LQNVNASPETDEGIDLARRMITMRLSSDDPNPVVDEIYDNQEYAVTTALYLLGMLAEFLDLETWQKSRIEMEKRNGI